MRLLRIADLSKEDREMLEMENMALQDELESELEALLKIEEELVKVTSMCEVASHKIQEQVWMKGVGAKPVPLSFPPTLRQSLSRAAFPVCLSTQTLNPKP
jgi:hypothetical protein